MIRYACCLHLFYFIITDRLKWQIYHAMCHVEAVASTNSLAVHLQNKLVSGSHSAPVNTCTLANTYLTPPLHPTTPNHLTCSQCLSHHPSCCRHQSQSTSRSRSCCTTHIQACQ